MRYVIIGNSAAAIGAVEGIRQIDQAGEIEIITDEACHTYSRPLISYLLGGKVTREKMKYRSEDFYEKHRCLLRYHAKVQAVQPKEKFAVLADGTQVPYDKLLVATGSSAFVPPFEGFETVKNKHTFMSMDDALGLQAALGKNKRVLIVGAGLIGLKCAEGIAGKVSGIHVVDLAPRILSSILDEGGAKRVQAHLEEKGIVLHLSCGIQRFVGNKAITSEGEEIPFDILVIAVGVRPNTALLEGIASTDKGIEVDGKSATDAPDIYAAGDCTQTMDCSGGESRPMAILPNAYMQGECAGINMAGGEKVFDTAIPMNAIGFFGLHIITAGHYNGEVTGMEDGTSYKRFFYSGNRLKGYILIGEVEKAGIYTSLLREHTPLDTIDFALVCEKPGLMAFAKEERSLKLGGGLG